MIRLFVAFTLAAGLALGQTAPVPAPTKKANGLVRQRAALKRQVGDLDELGWFFRPWPRSEPRPVAPAAPTPAAPAPVAQ